MFHVCLLHLPHHEQVALDLIKAGADLEKQIDSGHTALMLACQNGHSEVGTRFLDPTHHAYRHVFILSFSCQLRQLRLPNHEQVALELLKAGANLEKQLAKGFTALMLACEHGHRVREVATRFLDLHIIRTHTSSYFHFHVSYVIYAFQITSRLPPQPAR